MPECRRWGLLTWPDRLLGRITVVMAVGVICAQFAASVLWARQQRETERAEVRWAGHQLARNAADTIRTISAMPSAQRSSAIEQLQRSGGTRFFVHVNPSLLALTPLPDSAWAETLATLVRQDLMLQLQLPSARATQVALALADNLAAPAPVLVIQHALDSGHWLYLSTAMADTSFVDVSNPFGADWLVWQLPTLLIVLLPTLLLVRSLIRPLDHIAAAAKAFGGACTPEPIAETGTAELRRTARAFNAMLARIQGYLVDRECLFIGISHSLKTPIMRLKLRTELLDDSALRNEFHEDLDELDAMVQSALQSLRDTDIHENLTAVRLDTLLARLVKRPIHPDACICFSPAQIQVQGKPLALERAFGNLLDNAILYGQRVQLRLSLQGDMAMVEIRDFGPGIATASMAEAFEPHRRLSHGKSSNRSGTGLGLGIARNIVQAHGGEIRLHNHAEVGLVVTVLLPALSAQHE